MVGVLPQEPLNAVAIVQLLDVPPTVTVMVFVVSAAPVVASICRYLLFIATEVVVDVKACMTVPHNASAQTRNCAAPVVAAIVMLELQLGSVP
jgi:hypothetical protein